MGATGERVDEPAVGTRSPVNVLDAPGMKSRHHATGSRPPATLLYRGVIKSRHPRVASRRPNSPTNPPPDRTRPLPAHTERHRGRLLLSGKNTIRPTTERHDLERVRDDFQLDRNNFYCYRDDFFARALSGTPDASSLARPTRAGCMTVLSQLSIITSAEMSGHPPANARRWKYERAVS